jgi:hypothetical protein
MISMGLVKPYLDEYCEQEGYDICTFKDDVAVETFLWDREKSPLYKQGGWEATKKDYRNVLFDLLSTPEYFMMYTYKSLEYGFVQLFNFDIASYGPYKVNTLPYKAVDTKFHHEINFFKYSRQNTNALCEYEKKISTYQNFLILLSIISLLIIFIGKKSLPLSSRWKFLFVFIVLAVIINAFVVGSLSPMRIRYQSRVMWLITLPLMIYCIDNIKLLFLKFRINKNKRM